MPAKFPAELVSRNPEEAADLLVRGAGTAAEAMRLCGEVEPDLLIVDSGLPDANGVDLLQYLRRPGVPGILTSGDLSPKMSAAPRRLGFEPLEKLIGALRLVRIVRHLRGLSLE